MHGIYIRVSTVGQNEAGQRREILRWLKGNGIAEADCRFYVDKSTGDNLDRPDFERLQADIFNGEIKTVVVWRLDRLSRSLRDGVNVLGDWCDKGMRVVSVTQQIDFNGSTGRLLAAVLLGIGEMEQETRRERQAAGIAAAKERGNVYTGRKRGSTSKARPTRIAMAVSLKQQGKSHQEIAEALGVSKRSVVRYLDGDKAS